MSLRVLLNKVHNLDCIDFLKMIPDNTIDSCVTDPPYGLDFMGIAWDTGAISFNIEMWDLVRRVLKPGAHLLAFSETRTYHRLASAIEDAGFEIRNQIHWLYGTGFPKGLNISNAICEIYFEEWLIVHPKKKKELDNYYSFSKKYDIKKKELMIEANIYGEDGEIILQEAIKWLGFNTQLKPAHEPIVLAQKPISEKSIADNVLKWGVGAMNIGGCRVNTNPQVDAIGKTTRRTKRQEGVWEKYSGFLNPINPNAGVPPSGRYPANLILSHNPNCRCIQEGNSETIKMIRKRDTPRMGKYGIYGNEQSGWGTRYKHDTGKPEIWECVEGCPIREINEQSGNLKMGGSIKNVRTIIFGGQGIYNQGHQTRSDFRSYLDTGGAARFFYCTKPSKQERDAGLKGRNIHITVKPLAIIRWLIRLVTPRGGLVLDPFLGSGTTAIAAENENMNWLGSEINEEYCEIANLRILSLGGKINGGKNNGP